MRMKFIAVILCRKANISLGTAEFAAHGAMDCGQKIVMLVWRCHQFLSGFLALSVTSVMSVGDEVKPRTMCRSGIYLTAEENPGKPQLGDRLMKAVRPSMGSLTVKCR